MSQRWVNIEDIARSAGVSVATVSRALRDLPHVAPATKQRVRDVARELNYRPDLGASALAAGRTGVVTMAVPMLDSWYFSRVMAGAERVLADANYDVLLTAIDGAERRRRLLGHPFGRRMDGLILVDLHIPPEETDDIVASPAPVVTVGLEIEGTSAVLVDDTNIGRTAVDHLIAEGHRRIGLISGKPEDHLRLTVPQCRKRGYIEALTTAGIEPNPAWIAEGDFSVASGRHAMAALLDLDSPPSAVFAMSDEMAYGALGELWDRGLDAPNDVSIIGVDDHEISRVVGLSTVGQQVHDHGALAAELLLTEMSGETAQPIRRFTKSELIVRRTTGAQRDDG